MYKNTTILTELIQYLLDHCVESDYKRNITCRSVEQSQYGIKFVSVNNVFFEHSKKLQDWFHTTSINDIRNYLSIALEEVFGLRYSRNIQISITK